MTLLDTPRHEARRKLLPPKRAAKKAIRRDGVNAKIADDTIEHGYWVAALEEQRTKTYLGWIDDAWRQAFAWMMEHAAELSQRPLPAKSRDRVIGAIYRETKPLLLRIASDLYGELRWLADQSWRRAGEILATNIPDEVGSRLHLARLGESWRGGSALREKTDPTLFFQPPSVADIDDLVSSEGNLVDTWASLEGETATQIRKAVRLGIADGEGMPDIAARAERYLKGSVPGLDATKLARGGGLSLAGRIEAIVRTEVQRVSNASLRRVYHDPRNRDVLKGEQWIATLDERCCFPGHVRVLTPTGEVPIRDLRVGDWVIGGSGRPCRVTGVLVQRKKGAFGKIRLGGRLLEGTADHPIATRRGWVKLGELLAADDVVCDQELVKSSLNGAVAEPGFLEADNGDVLAGENLVATLSLLGIEVPEAAVGLDVKAMAWQEEVEAVGTDLLFLDEPDRTGSQHVPQGSFNASLASVLAVAAARAKSPSVARLAGADAKPLAAIGAAQMHGRSATRLGTVLGLVSRRRLVDDPLAASLAAGVCGGCRSAPVATHDVPIGVGCGDTEPLLTDGARLEYAVCRSGAVAGQRTELAGRSSTIPEPFLARLAVDPCALHEGAAVIVARHGHIIAQPAGDSKTFQSEMLVFDITVEADHSFFAEGVLVHNCDRCGGLDGSIYYFDHGRQMPPIPLHSRCRCVASGFTKSWQELGFPDAVEMSPGVRASMNGDVPDKITMPAWFATQPAARQRRMLGPGRFGELKRFQGKATAGLGGQMATDAERAAAEEFYGFLAKRSGTVVTSRTLPTIRRMVSAKTPAA